MVELDVLDLRQLAYEQAFEVQRELHGRVATGATADTVILVEHPAVITVSRRREAGGHLLADEATLQRMGIQVSATDRGGDVTYHGPGQLVAYPIIKMDRYGLNLGRYMRLLETVVIATIGRYGVQGFTEKETGVWVEDASGTAKICALGVRIAKGTTMHGLALNVTTDLAHFGTIVPCGLAGRRVTSLSQVLNEACPTMEVVKGDLVEELRKGLGKDEP